MFLEVRKGDTVLIDGPSSVRVVSGRVSVLGAELTTDSELSVSMGKRLPVEAEEASSLDLKLNEGSSYLVISEDAIPASWKEAAEQILGSGISKVMILGQSDAGKSSFSLFLSNLAMARGKRPAIIDADIGQSDIGPPASVGLAVLSEQRTSLHGVRPAGLSFVGAKNPSSAILPLLRSIKRMRKRAIRTPLDLLIINTDGWVRGDTAVYLKYVTAEIFEVEAVVAIKKENELDEVMEALGDFKIISVRSPTNIRVRDREIRREIRRQNFARFLKGGSERSFPLKMVHGLNESEEWRGLLVGLEGERWRLLGIGIIQLIDWQTKEVEILTSVKEEVKSIQVGKIRLDADCNEIEDIA